MLNIVKGQKISLEKEAPGLTKALVGLGWDINADENEYFVNEDGIREKKTFDLDAEVFMIRKGNIKNELVFFKHFDSNDGSIHHHGDNVTGAGEGDDEQIDIDFSKIPEDVDELIITTTIYRAEIKKQNFGQVENAYIRIAYADTEKDVAKYDLSEDYSANTAIIVGRFYRHDGGWKFEAKGKGVNSKLEELIDSYKIDYAISGIR